MGFTTKAESAVDALSLLYTGISFFYNSVRESDLPLSSCYQTSSCAMRYIVTLTLSTILITVTSSG